ncbi:insulinase family protein [Waterburya agarophytonicola K14]|uniref:Insulinase family protein n=1 Tax=Waterburya agarophytonicola KI4 TaxID=2874699 RepID=A0A964BNQ5_9CYAN|nr:pitrilysin family protein [Waterburya agarophytonicola]MCC0176469.1 insulinase family protein [Waterburya agarophytonicola KI4]
MSKKLFSWLSLVLLTVLLSFTLRTPAIADTPKHYTELEFPPIPEIQLPEYDRYELDNGMVVYLLEDRDLPLISGTALIRTGSRFEPSNKVGLAALTGSMMRGGGTKNHPAAELNSILEQKAASVETNIGNTSGSASFSTLTEDFNTVFPLFVEVLRQPAFAPDKFAIAKKQQQGSIARRNDDPGDIASREFDKIIYGDTSPYARTIEYETLDNISRQDTIDFYRTYVRPENIILGIAGDFDSDRAIEQIQNAFADWQVDTPPPALSAPSTSQKHLQGVFVVDRPKLTQSNILLGHIGGQLNSPDYATMSVLNGVLNGFGGRLFNEVRSRQGLAYSVYGAWSPSYDFDGLFIAGGQTQTEKTVPFVKSVVSEIKKLRNQLVTEQELDDAKESILNSFVFNFQSPSQTLSRLMRYEYFDYPEDFIFDYQDKVQNTTEEDILNAAIKYLQPDKLVTLVVGNKQGMNPPLDSLNQEINLVDVSIPPPGNS